MGFVQRRLGHPDVAEPYLRAALEQFPDDDWTLRELAGTFVDRGQVPQALALLPIPAEQDAEAWFERAVLLDRNADGSAALEAARRTLQADKRHLAARFLTARALCALGRIDEAAEEYRRLTRVPGTAPRAWFGLLDLKTARLAPGEFRALERAAAQAGSAEDRKLLAFALGRACEDAGRPEAAVAAFDRANQRQRRDTPWDAAAFTRIVEGLRASFPEPMPPSGSRRGEQVIFVVGMPRSGTTLVEQVLAGHSRVVGASELPDVGQIVTAESSRRGQPFPDWIHEATEADWQRLGEEYLERTRRWQTRARFTDKMPENWLYVGLLLRMLPGARFLGCERDPLETAWSCYKQMFAPGHFAWSYDHDALAAYARDQRVLWRHFAERQPGSCRTVSYEGLVADFEPQVREILRFLDLDFEVGCLDFPAASRETRSASSAQVRRPLDRSTARLRLYGRALDSLVQAMRREGLG
jgi:tetratricopeptide (TPR) repeat protein